MKLGIKCEAPCLDGVSPGVCLSCLFFGASTENLSKGIETEAFYCVCGFRLFNMFISEMTEDAQET